MIRSCDYPIGSETWLIIKTQEIHQTMAKLADETSALTNGTSVEDSEVLEIALALQHQVDELVDGVVEDD